MLQFFDFPVHQFAPEKLQMQPIIVSGINCLASIAIHILCPLSEKTASASG
jgi:hypothetical protein